MSKQRSTDGFHFPRTDAEMAILGWKKELTYPEVYAKEGELWVREYDVYASETRCSVCKSNAYSWVTMFRNRGVVWCCQNCGIASSPISLSTHPSVPDRPVTRQISTEEAMRILEHTGQPVPPEIKETIDALKRKILPEKDRRRPSKNW